MLTRPTSAYLYLVALGTVLSIDQQCINHNTVPRTHNRSQNNSIILDRTNAPCDNFADGWYRFENGEIATSCVSPNHCGTISTVWMKDPIPAIGHTKENIFCVNSDMAGSDCCLFEFRINVTNCGGLLVYFFRRGDLLCPSGYCTTNLKSCKDGDTSPTGFEPCSDKGGVPVMTAPVLKPPQLATGHHVFTQHCDVGYSGSETNIVFIVTWLFDGVVYKNVHLTGGIRRATLSSSDWTGHIGQKLSCRAESYYNTAGGQTKSQALTSNEYHGTITITPNYLTALEGEEVTFTLTSTLPTLCSRVPPVICKLDLELMVTGGTSDNIFGVGGCSVRFWGHDWNATTGQVLAMAKVSTINHQSSDKTVYALTYRATSDSLGHPMWSGFVANPVQLTVSGTLKTRRYKENSLYESPDKRRSQDTSDLANQWICKCKGQNAKCDPSVKVNSILGGIPLQPGVVG